MRVSVQSVLLLLVAACSTPGDGASSPAEASRVDSGVASTAARAESAFAAFADLTASDLAAAAPAIDPEPQEPGEYVVLGNHPRSAAEVQRDAVLERRARILRALEPQIYEGLDRLHPERRADAAERIAHRIVEEGIEAIDAESAPTAADDEERAARILREECGE